MTELLTAAQMRAIEQAAIDSGAVTGLELMERAGQGVVDAIYAEWPTLAPAASAERGASPSRSPEVLRPDEEGSRRAVVLCGPGNNGGDGFVVARLLQADGWAVEVFLYGNVAKLPPDARVNYERWCAVGEVIAQRIDPPPLIDDSFSIAKGTSLIIDALFGIGLSRPYKGVFTMLADGRDLIASSGCKVVSVDVPTGLCADSGKILGRVLPSDLTVTFHTKKLGHVLTGSTPTCGPLRVVDIGLREVSPSKTESPDLRVTSVNLAAFAGQVTKSRRGHKYTHGHALILAGGVGKGGAARLAARGALRIGAGAVTVGCPPAALIENAAQLNAIMLQRAGDAEGLKDVLTDDRINALCIGPGLGLGDREAGLLEAILRQDPPRLTVLDADALTLLAQNPNLFAMLHDNCVLTPHAGEFRRLFPDIADKLDAPATTGPAYSKVDATRAAAKQAGCIILLKGPDTVIAAPDGRCSINASVYERSAPWLATAGSGDVLAGFITGLLARGFGPMQAAETGAWLHTECALEFGPGLIAEDLPEELPKVLRRLGVS